MNDKYTFPSGFGASIYTPNVSTIKIKDIKSDAWTTANTKRRSITNRNIALSNFGIGPNAVMPRLNGKMLKRKDCVFEVSGKPGNFEGENYDAIFQMKYGGDTVYTVLYKDVEITKLNECSNIKVQSLRKIEEISMNGKEYVVAWAGSKDDINTIIQGNGNEYTIGASTQTFNLDGYTNNDGGINTGIFILNNSDDLSLSNEKYTEDLVYLSPFNNIENQGDYRELSFDYVFKDNDNYLVGYGFEKPMSDISYNFINDNGVYHINYDEETEDNYEYDFAFEILDGKKVIARINFEDVFIQCYEKD